ncbi:MAG: hypothetical protein KGI78_00755 [Patescibacteria group bacterium]|nr:hypothetical protein [Patescibacteria group bacterium]MDE1944429.1 hypothetical protein [Patescibacteria group bacterium]MDE1944683.1 hypothetical protein [Patescibacteria group bacterium]MDE2057369.1 hypothetical protein [Patescibacteria group bacterium]
MYGNLPLSGSFAGAHSGQTLTIHGTVTGAGGSSTCSATLTVVPPAAISGTITATSCTIPAGQGSCGIADSWAAQNTQYTDGQPLTQVNVYQNGSLYGGAAQQGYNWTNTRSNSGSYTFTLPPGTYDMALYGYSGSTAVELDDKTATAACAAGTNWDPGSSTCKAQQQVPNGGNVTGNFESANCSALTGWAFDGNSSSASIDVQVYTQGSCGVGCSCIGACNYIGQYSTDVYRGDVNSAFGISGNHGFSIPLPDAFKDGGTYQVNVYGVAADNSGRRSIGNDPLTVSGCTVPPTVSLTADGQSSLALTSPGQNYTLAWSSAHATSCTMTDNRTDGYPDDAPWNAGLSGSAQSGLLGSYTYTCTGPGGSASATATITGSSNSPNGGGGGNSCGAPSATISATPSRISGSSGQAQISWSGSGVSSSCVVTANGATIKTDTASSCAVAPDQLTETVSQQTKYCISCDGATSGDGYKCVLVNVGNQFIHF